MDSIKIIVVSILSLLIGLLIGYKLAPKQENVIYKPIYKERLIRDSLYIINDSIQTKIKYITKHYYEKRDSILNNDSTADMLFFTEYIKRYQRADKNSQFNFYRARINAAADSIIRK